MAKLYRNFITRELKFSNREAMLEYMEGKGLDVTVEGCYVTNTSSYVDISLNTLLKPDKIFEYSSVLFNQDYTSYIAYIDSIEPNNFNGQDGTDRIYYRLYITIDWWSTIMYQSNGEEEISSICNKIDGIVERAHVDDVVAVLEDDQFVYHKTTQFTTKDAEYPAFKLKNSNTILLHNTNKKFIWILGAGELGGGDGIDTFMVGGRFIPYQYKLYVLPLFSCDLYLKVGEEMIYKSAIGSSSVLTPSCVDDRNVVSMYISDYCPYFDDAYNRLVIPVETEALADAYTPSEISLIGDKVGYAVHFPTTSSILHIPAVKFESQGIKTFFNNKVSIPQNYSEYALNCIAKLDYAPYTNVILKCDGNSCLIQTDKINKEAIMEYSITPSSGGMYIYFNYNLYSPDYSADKYKVLSSNNAFPPMSINDDLTAMSRQVIATNGQANNLGVLGNIVNMGTSLFKGDVRGVFSSAQNIISGSSKAQEISIQEKKLELYGESGYSLTSTALASYYEPPLISIYEPIDSDKIAIIHDLVMYGYNTYLHPTAVLNAHRRKFFNFVKISSTKLNTYKFSADIRKQIEELFNSGAWFWNTSQEFGNFEVPNYPIRMEVTNV